MARASACIEPVPKLTDERGRAALRQRRSRTPSSFPYNNASPSRSPFQELLGMLTDKS